LAHPLFRIHRLSSVLMLYASHIFIFQPPYQETLEQ